MQNLLRRIEKYFATEYPDDNEHAPEFHVTVSDLKAIAGLNEENCRLKEELAELKEKETPKQVGYIAGVLGEKYECPYCGSSLTDSDLFAGHCKWCGQAIEDK